MLQFLKKLGINIPGYYNKDTYIIDLKDANEYAKIATKLDKSTELEEIEDFSISNISISNLMYENDNYVLNLIADFDNNIYKLEITEVKDD